MAYESRGLGLAADASEEDIWRCVYFIRRLSVSLQEAAGLFQQEVQKYGNDRQQLSPRLTEAISAAREQLVASKKVIAPIRNSLGAHIRPKGALVTEDRIFPDVEARMLASLQNEKGTVHLDFKDNLQTSFRGVTRLSVFMLWPNKTTTEEILDEHGKISNALLLGSRAAIQAIDIVLASYWIECKVIEVPDDQVIQLTLPEGWPRNIQFE